MSFNPNVAYRTYVDLNGNVYAYQAGVYYDKYGNSFTSLPSEWSGVSASADVSPPNGGNFGGAPLSTAQLTALTTTGAATLITTAVAYLSTAQLAVLCANNDQIVKALHNLGLTT